MLVLEVFRYLKRRADKRPVGLTNFVSMECHHGKRFVEAKVSIIIPTRDKYELLRSCIESIKTKTTYRNYEIVVINNASSEAQTIEYLDFLRSTEITVLDYPHGFNYSKISNFGADNTDSDYLCFLNNDTEVLEPQWLSLLMGHAVQQDVGVVGAKLLYPEGSIQHLGIALGYLGVAGHVFNGVQESDVGSLSQKCFEVSAVTFACALVSRKQYYEVGGLDTEFRIGLNDVDFGMRTRMTGRKNVVCGQVKILHHESQSRHNPLSILGLVPAVLETIHFMRKYSDLLSNDEFYSFEVPQIP